VDPFIVKGALKRIRCAAAAEAVGDAEVGWMTPRSDDLRGMREAMPRR